MNLDALRDWVTSRTGLPVIWSHPDAPRPERPYVALQITALTRIARETIGSVDEDGIAQISGDRDAVISVTVYERADAADPRAALTRAVELRDSLELPSVRNSLYVDGWALRAVEFGPNDVPELLDTQWEPRAVFDVRFGTSISQDDDLGLIEAIAGTGTVNGQSVEFDTREGS